MEVILKLLVYDRPGVLDRVAGIIRRKAWNIGSITAGAVSAGKSQISLSLASADPGEIRELCEYLAELDFLLSWEQCAPETHLLRELLVFAAAAADAGELARRNGIKLLRTEGEIAFLEYVAMPAQVSAMMRELGGKMLSCSRSGKRWDSPKHRVKR